MIKNINDINKYIKEGRTRELIQSGENFHARQYDDIIDILSNGKSKARFICIAGPSASGKTTFAEKLKQKLLNNGIESLVISMDNYFIDKKFIKADENGNYDFETIDIVDIELFNEQLLDLLSGKEVYMPKYNFTAGEKEFSTTPIKINDGDMIFVEGIHALNYEKLFCHFDKELILGIYIRPDDFYETASGELIEPHQIRLIRRSVRDVHYRNYALINTFKMWDNVRAGEHRYIVPNKGNADFNFNSSLKYELPVLKKFFIEEYNKLNDNEKSYCEKYICKEKIEEFLCIDADEVPQTSILNEFIP